MKLALNYISTLVYQLLVVILPIVTLPYLSRIFLPQNMGVNSLITSISSYFLLFAVFGLAVHGQKETAFYANDMGHLRKVFWEIEILSILLTLVSVIAYILTTYFMPEYRLYILATAPLILANALDISWLFIGLQKLPMVMTRNFIVKLVTVAAIFMFVKSNNDLFILMLINSVSAMVSNGLLWLFLPKVLHFVPVKIQNIKKHFVSGAVLFLPAVSIAVYTILSRIILGMFGSLKDVAYFDNSDKIIRTLLTIITATTLTIMPEVSRLFSTHKDNEIFTLLKKVVLLSLAFAIPATIGVSVISKQFATLFFGLPYRSTGTVMQIEIWIMIPIAIANVIANQFFVPMNKGKYITYAVSSGAIMNIIISVPLVMYFGAIGTAIAILATEMLVSVIQICQMGKNFKKIIEAKEIAKIIASSVIMGIIVLLFRHFTNNLSNYFQITYTVCFGFGSYILMLFLFKSEVLKIFFNKNGRRKLTKKWK
jgi:O-antigen/teichoic acid export membrane protein